jgi:hypothetical protein
MKTPKKNMEALLSPKLITVIPIGQRITLSKNLIHTVKWVFSGLLDFIFYDSLLVL